MSKTDTPAIELFRTWISKDPRKQGQIAIEIGVSEAVFSRWKNGRQEPIRMARMAIDKVSNGAVPSQLPWATVQKRRPE